MSIAELVLTTVSMIGLILFSQFLYENWKEKEDKRNKGDFHY